MKTSTILRRTLSVLSVAALLTYVGCTSRPLRQSTGEMDLTPTPATWEAGGHVYQIPNAIETVQPYYPVDLRRMGITGTVMVACTVDEAGKVIAARVVNSTDSDFNQPALDAVRKWTFKPFTEDGVPAKKEIEVPVRFTLDD